MYLDIPYIFFQKYWWIIISILGAALVVLLFVQGGQTLINAIGKNEKEKSTLYSIFGSKWETTFTTLVTFGGAFFASFPLFYATSFGGAYWLWIIILFSFIIQAISYEFRNKEKNFLGKKTYETFLYINGTLGPFFLGVAVSTFFTGASFTVDNMNFSQWQNPLHGLETLTNIFNIVLGLAIFFLARLLGILYIINVVKDQDIYFKSKKQIWINAIPFLAFFLTYVVFLFLKNGYAYDPGTGVVTLENYKYLNNFIQMPLIATLFILGVVGVLVGLGITLFSSRKIGIWLFGPGTGLVVFSLFSLAGLNNTSFYPSTYDPQSSLTIMNASSSYYTLKIMSFVSLFIPVVIFYIYYAWKSLNKEEKESEGETTY